MGFFDKLKHMAGGHGVTVNITQIEGQSADSATFPINDSIIKGHFQINGTNEVTILNHTIRFYAVYENEDGLEREVLLDEEVKEGEIMFKDYSWPYELRPGQTVQDSFCVGPFNIIESIGGLGLTADDAFRNPDIKFKLKVIADVKGTPLDASDKRTITIVPGGGSPEEEIVFEAITEIPVRTETLPLDPRPYLERFNEMIAGLQAHPKIEVTEVKINEPATPEAIDSIAANYPVPPAMRSFYEQVNGLTVRWEVPGKELHGNINILPIEEVCSSWKGQIWFDEEWDEGESKPLHPLDYFIDEACCALYIDGSENPRVYYHYCGEEMNDLEVDFAGYIELVLKSRGFWYWPTAIVTDLTGDEYTTEPGKFRRNMPNLFDDYQASFFLRRDFSEKDAEQDEIRSIKVTGIRGALYSNGVDFSIPEDGEGGGYIHINVLDNEDNLAKVSEAVKILGIDDDFTGDWGARSIGEYMFEKTNAI